MVQESLRAFKYGPLRSQSTSSTGSGSAFQAAASEEGVAGVTNGNHANSSNNASNGRAGASASTTGANGGSKVSHTSSTSSGHGTCTVSTPNSAGGIGLPLATARASRRSFVLYVAVTLALERKQYHRELVSQLLAECVSPIGRGLALRPRPASGVNGTTSAPLLEADEDEDDDSPVSTPSATNLNANPFDKTSSEDSSETRFFFAQADAEAGFDRLIRELPELVLCVDLLWNYTFSRIDYERTLRTAYEFYVLSLSIARSSYLYGMCRDLSGPKLLPDQVGMFIARASADGVINRERFFEKYKGVVEDSFARCLPSLTRTSVFLHILSLSFVRL